MRGQAPESSMQRLVTGYGCEVRGCYQTALWLILFGGETYHWCSKHTRGFMKENYVWKGRNIQKAMESAAERISAD